VAEKEPLDIKTALGRDNTIVIAPNRMTATLVEAPKKGEARPPAPPDLDNALATALGCPLDHVSDRQGPDGKTIPGKCQAQIVGRILTGHLRKGDVIVVAKEMSPGGGYSLHGPVVIEGELWNRTAKMNAGDIHSAPFFEAIARLAHPMTCKRRSEPENGYFELGHA
jgi:hypothetical protein